MDVGFVTVKYIYNETLKLAIIAISSSLIALGFASASFAQQSVMEIEILVNDEPISSYDIDQRLRLVIAASGGVSSQDELDKVREQVTTAMIDERLQLQEARIEFDFTIPDEEMEGYFVRRAQSMGQTPDQLATALISIGSSKKTMIEQMRAEVVWEQIVGGRLGQFVAVTDEEVEAIIQRMHDNKGKFEFRIAEIEMLVSNSSQDAAVKAAAEKLVEQIKDNAGRFPDIARQISASPSSANGGDLGWVSEADLTQKTKNILLEVGIGGLTSPLKTPGGYRILAVQDRRKILSIDPLDTQVMLNQFMLKKPQSDNESDVKKFRDAALALGKNPLKCEDLASKVSDFGADPNTSIGAVRYRDLPDLVREPVENALIGVPSDVVSMEDGLHVLIVCDRQDPVVQEPNFDQIYSQIEGQRLAMMGRRYLRDLRRDAIIDRR